MPWLANGLIVAGALLSVAGAVRINFAYIRYVRSRRVQADDQTARAISLLEMAA